MSEDKPRSADQGIVSQVIFLISLALQEIKRPVKVSNNE